jgi:hypothetical protein
VNAKATLDAQIILKKGRLNGFGYEPAWSSYFDFYISAKYVSPQLIRLEDAMFHLFLRKNLNTRNPEWKMPSIRQMMRRLCISQRKVEGIMNNLIAAHLLTKESGFRKGELGKNIQNTYILSDPIQTLDEFIAVAQENLFPYPLRSEYSIDPCTREAYSPVCEEGTPPVREEHTQKQTSSFKQTSEKQIDPAFEELRFLIGEKTFDRFMDGAKLIAIGEGTAVIGIINAYAKDWIENRIKDKIKRSLKVEGVRCVVLTE